MTESIDLFEAIDTQRGIRRFKSDPVPDELITRLLRAAIKAPSGGVRQGWSFIVVRDQNAKNKIGELYRTGDRFSITPELTRQVRCVYAAAQYLEDHMEDVPAFILACIQTNPDGSYSAASIYPAVQNILLAARGLGLGCCLTTRQTRFERDIKRLFNIPDDVATAALLPLGFPAEGEGYGPTRRKSLEEVSFDGTWGHGWQIRDSGQL